MARRRKGTDDDERVRAPKPPNGEARPANEPGEATVHPGAGVAGPDANAALIQDGDTNPAAIAEAPRAEIVAASGPQVDGMEAARAQTVARAQSAFLNSVAVGIRADLANGRAVDPETAALADALRADESGDGVTAVSPCAYLADLVDYSLAHVKRQSTAGLVGEYYSGRSFNERKLTRLDPTIDFDWGVNSPAAVIPVDEFSIRWTGWIEPRYSETYTLSTLSDDGVRLWIDDRLLIDNWTIHALFENTGTIALEAGRRYPFKLEYFEATSGAIIKLFWSSPRQAKEIVPQTQLFSRPPIDLALPVDLASLTNLLYQPFADLPVSPGLVDRRERQVRLCVEVLRRYLAARSKPAVGSAQQAALDQAQQEYRLAAYTTLLTQLGTSLAELRLARTADPDTRQRLADRLGFPPEHLDDLYPNPEKPDPEKVTEADLERLCGLVDTTITRDPLSDGQVLKGTPPGQITHVQLDGVTLGADRWTSNVDLDGIIYAKLTKASATQYLVQLFRDRARSVATLVASGTSATPQGSVVLKQANASGLSGNVEIAYASDSTDIELSVSPALLGWQLQNLRTLWAEQDWPTDADAAPSVPGAGQAARTNVALAATGATATAWSSYESNPPEAVVNGDRKGASGRWMDDTPSLFPDWIQVDFAQATSINEIDVFMAQDASPVEPTETLTFSRNGLTAFEVQYWNGTAWATVPGGAATGNNKVWCKFALAPAVTTARIRVLGQSSPSGRSQVVEIEAYEVGTRRNVALAANGGRATSSSTYHPYPLSNAIDSNRKTSMWYGRMPQQLPGWFQVDFGGPKVIDEVDVFSYQDSPIVDPTEDLRFTSYGLVDFDVQFWDGSTWVTMPDGSVTNNDRVWRKLTFPPLLTDKVRLFIRKTASGWTLLPEIEVYASAASPATRPLPPIVDPDLIGPDDFRTPVGKAVGDPTRAFDLWLKRRGWVDGRLRALAAMTKPGTVGGKSAQVPDLAAMLASMAQPVAYGGLSRIPWPGVTMADLEGLDESLSAGIDVEATRSRVEGELGLIVEAFTRLMSLRARDCIDATVVEDEALEGAEWQEVYSILVQAQKSRLFPDWWAEEKNTGVLFGPAELWPSLREPVEGAWPPVQTDGAPLIDPEIVRLNDLPEPTAGRRARSLWQARRARLDRITQDLRAMSGFDAKLKLAFGDPLPCDLDRLEADLKSSDPAVVQAAEATITARLQITVAAFSRLMVLKARAATPKSLTASEWAEVHATLTTAHKVRQEYAGWLAAERDSVTGIDYWTAVKARLPRWRATAEARQAWHQALRARSQPSLVDPDLIGLVDLNAPRAGAPAFDLWQSRQGRMQARLDALKTTQGAAPSVLAGLDQILAASLFDVGLDASLANPRLSGLPGQLKRVREAKGLQVALTDAFGDLASDLGRLWDDLRAGGPAAAAARPTIRRRLGLADEAFLRLMEYRARDIAGAQPLTPAEWTWIERTLAQAMLIVSLVSLEDQRKQGLDLTRRLGQLDLDRAAYARLIRVRDLVVANQPVLDTEWADLYAILTQVGKQREAAVWRREEQAGGLTLGPDFFQIPAGDPTVFPPPPPPELQAWRATWKARRDWQDTLETRISQERTVAEALGAVVGAVEEATLPSLRDALVAASDAPAGSLNDRAKWLTDRVLIDTRMGATQKTTRTALAIETIQSLLFSLRSGQLQDTYPDLVLDDGSFDEVWKWLGSYATWRAAMFVYLYPENILLPQLHRWQTPAFRQLVGDVRASRRLTPQQARRAAQDYLQYFRDVTSLTPSACCQAQTRMWPESHRRDLIYMFAAAPSGQAYWSARDPADTTGYRQSPWEPVQGLSTVTAAIPYARLSERHIYLFGFLSADSKQERPKFGFVRYNLETRAWESEQTEIELPDGSPADQWPCAGQRCFEDQPPHLVINTQGNDLYHMELNYDGTAGSWEPLVSRSLGTSGKVWEVAALIEINPGLICLVAWDGSPYLNSGLFVGEFHQVLELGVEVWESYARNWQLVDKATSFDTALISDWPGDSEYPLYLLYSRSGQGPTYRAIQIRDASVSQPFVPPDGLARLKPSSGRRPPEVPRQFFCESFSAPGRGPWCFSFTRNPDKSLAIEPARVRAAPSTAGTTVNITDQLSAAQLDARTILTRRLLEQFSRTDPDTEPHSRQNTAHLYVYEAFYAVPVHLALQLQQRGEYTAALDWLRTVYDASRPPALRKIYYGLVAEESLSELPERAVDWLLDPLNPHAIAATRARTYTRFTLQAIVRCLLDYADAEFTRDTAESVARARVLYMTALELLDTAELGQQVSAREALLAAIDAPVGDRQAARGIAQLRRELRRIEDPAGLETAVAAVRTALADGAGPDGGFVQARAALAQAAAGGPCRVRLGAVLEEKPARLAAWQRVLLQHGPVALAADAVGVQLGRLPRDGISNGPAAGDPSFGSAHHLSSVGRRGTTGGETTTGDAGGLPTGASGAAPLALGFVPAVGSTFSIPPNPVMNGLRLRAELNLYKLRNGRNIAGLERVLEPYAAPTDLTSGLPTIGAGGQLVLPATASPRPTAYRYQTLIERAKQLVALSQQVETAFLTALERRDAEYVSLLKARQDMRLARAGVKLQSLRYQEADHGVQLATLQQQRAQLQVDHYQELIDGGVSPWELLALECLAGSAALQFTAALAVPLDLEKQLSSVAAALTTTSTILNTWASYERRRQEWEFQKSLADKDVEIGAQQVTLAQDRLNVVGQEQTIATMQADSAEVIADFLATKFTNADLYDWMSGVLERVFSYFLEQATATARLAADQFAFERQEPAPPYIQADYWESANEGEMGVGTDGSRTDRRGLTGSARLLQDIHQLDEYAFATDRRKLQLAKTISLAQLDPYVFQRFRQTGVLPFATPMELFDRDFPGHYLRLVKRVRTSVVALVPTTDGIHATLASRGTSRVVIGGDIFQTVVMRRPPETVALTSPRDATGVFDLELRPEMLLPFEGLGVDASWEFRLPRAANRFDFRTIADVLMTIEYTALDSFEYRQQVLASLNRRFSANRVFSFRQQLPDLWYDLHNPEQARRPMVVSFDTRADDFPPNLEGLKIEGVLLYFFRANGAGFEVPVGDLRFVEQGSSAAVGGSASSMGGVIRAPGNAGSWTSLIGKYPVGRWELALPDTDEMKERFKQEEIDDILFVLTYAGDTPEWPA